MQQNVFQILSEIQNLPSSVKISFCGYILTIVHFFYNF